jgi:hypothetical protein
MVNFVLGIGDLVPDFVRYPLAVLRMDHAPEGKAGHLLEFFQAAAAEDVADGFVGIQQFFVLVRFIEKETAGHMLAELPDDGKAFFV